MNQLYRLFAFLFFPCCALQLAAQCPSFVGCPVKTDTFCATGLNDNQLWNAPVFLDPLNNINDLYETPADLSMQVKTTCGNAAAVQIRCLLYLDLDGNGTQETVVDSDNMPPAGTVMKGNALNPNFAGGDPVNFDTRPVAANQKWGFGFKKVVTGDTITAGLRWKTDAQPVDDQMPQLPAGLHRVVWLLQEPGGGMDTCSRVFRVVDCKAPVVVCQPGLSVVIMPTGIIQLWASDFLKYTEDNITPTNKLQIAIRQKGTGTGFPVDGFGTPITSVIFTCTDLSFKPMELWSRDKTGNVSFCETSVIVNDNLFACHGQLPGYKICALHFCNNKPIEEYTALVSYTVQGNPTIEKSIPVLPDINGCGIIKPGGLPFTATTSIEPFKDDSPLSGVSTYDLVLISKHILGLEPLNTPYKMIAADANRSGSITTYDIVEIRKLILGINTEFSNNTSWRFVDRGFQFPEASNPFKTTFPENINFNPYISPVAPLDFIAIKIGDVNCSTSPLLTSEEITARTPTTLALPDRILSTGETIELPLQLTTASQWLGAQFGLEYDPQLLEIQSTESNTLPGFDTGNWAQPRAGRLNVSWSGATPITTLPNDPIITLRVRVLASVRLRDAIRFTDERIRPELYDLNAQPVPLQLVFHEQQVSANGASILDPQPNPTTDAAAIPIRLLQPENVDVILTDLAGRTLHQRTIGLDAGTHLLEIPASAFPHTGVYGWRVQAGNLSKTGKIVKQ